MSKRFFRMFVVVALVLFGQIGFSATITKEFTFETLPGETVKNWEINIPLPPGETGKFIGRDFKPIVNKDALLEVEKEVLSEKNYYAKGILIGVPSKEAQISYSGKIQISIYTGKRVLNDVPAIPNKIAFDNMEPINIEWEGPGDKGKTMPVSAKYFYYQIKNASTDGLIAEQIVPVYLTGFKFKIRSKFQEDLKYHLVVQMSNVSGQYSKPFVINIEYPSKPKN